MSPAAFWFALTLPVIVILYLLRRKRVTHLVASTVLWQRFLAENQANAPFQKLRNHLLLWLQLLLLALIIFALSRPFFASTEVAGRLLVAIVDASASMQSTDVSPNRFEASRKLLQQQIDGMSPSDSMVLLQAGVVTEVLQSATRDKTLLRQAMGRLHVSDAASTPADALNLALTLIKNTDRPEVHLFSDGAFGSLDQFENQQLPLVLHPVGARIENAGIVGMEAKANPENPSQRAVFVTVANGSSNRMDRVLELRFGEDKVASKAFQLAPAEVVSDVFLVNQSRNGVFTAKLLGDDDLASDNEASVISTLPPPIKVTLVTAGNRFLEKALRSIPNLELSIVSALPSGADGADLVVLDNVAVPSWPNANVLCFAQAPTNIIQVTARVEAPAIVDWRTAHPILRFVNLDGVSIAEALSFNMPPWGVAMVDGAKQALVIAGEFDRHRTVYVAFDLLQSTWPLRISFPIFMANAVDWLNPSVVEAARTSFRAGTALRWNVPSGTPSVEITMPDLSKRTMQVDTQRLEIVFGETWQHGLYQLHYGTNFQLVAANLLSGLESTTPPKTEISLGKYSRSGGAFGRPTNYELWRWILVAGLLLCMGEWWYFHRRTA